MYTVCVTTIYQYGNAEPLTFNSVDGVTLPRTYPRLFCAQNSSRVIENIRLTVI